MHSRTIERGTGAQLGTFTTETVPTALQVTGLIEEACAEIVARNGTIYDACSANAKAAAKWLTAMFVEVSHFTNQVGDDPDAYDRFKENYERTVEGLGVCLTNNIPDDGDGEGTDAAYNTPVGGFPGLVGTTLTEEF